MYLITCGASWVNGDYSWVEEVTEDQHLPNTPFLTDDFTDATAYRIILKNLLKCDTYTNLAYGGSTNQTQIDLLKDVLKNQSHRDDLVVLFGLLPFESETQLDELLSLDIKHLFLFNTICIQSVPNSLFDGRDLLSLLSEDDSQVSTEDWRTCEVYFRKMYRAFKRGLVNLDNHHMTKKGNAIIACSIFSQIQSRFV